MSRPLSSVGSVQPTPRRAFRPLVRPRVSQLLDSAYQYPVTVLIAGAGYGKSVALEHWLAQKQEPVVRYNVREGTRGVFDFALGLAQALSQTVKIGPRAAANAVKAAEQSQSPETDLAVWIDNAIRKFSGTIVIDDVHVAADDDHRLARLISQVIDRTDGRVHWILSSRSASGLPITSWIAYGKSQMAIGERELAFTHEEAGYTASQFAPELSSAQINELYDYTGGWPTAMTFALLSSQRTFDLAELRASTRELSYRYLAEQVLMGIDPADAAFLRETAVYPVLTVDLLAAAGYPEPRARLDFLKEHGSFVSVDADGAVRYHDLFRDFLRNELGKRDQEFAAAWQRSARAYESLGDYVHALAAFEAVGDLPGIERILEEHGFALIDRGRRGRVVQALERLSSAGLEERNPVILALRANAANNAGNPERAETWYRAAIERARTPVEHATLCLQFARELVQAYRLDGIGILEPTLRATLPPALRVAILGTLATYYAQAARQDDAFAMMREALGDASCLPEDEVRATLLHQHAFLLAWSGDLKGAEEQALRALQIAKALELPALCARIQSLLYYATTSRDNVSQGIWWAKQMERSANEAGDSVLRFSALVGMYDIEVERGNTEPLSRYNEALREFSGQQFYRASLSLAPSFALQAAWQRRFDDAVQMLSGSESEQPSGFRRALRAAEIALYAAAAGRREQSEAAAGYAQEQLNANDRTEYYAPQRHAKALLFLGLSAMLLGKMSVANRYIADAEKLGGSLSERYRALLSAVRQMFVHVETRAIDDPVS